MENENRLLELMNTDQDMLGKILSTSSKEDALAVAKEAILDYTPEELDRDLQEIKAIIYGEEEALNMEDLDTVVGGAPDGGPRMMGIPDPHALKGWIKTLDY